MKKYVALLRGIGPGNPNMRNDKLRGVFEDLGFLNVQSVISSGNILFESRAGDPKILEEKIEKDLQKKLGINGKTIIRSDDQMRKLFNISPFKKIEHSQKTSLNVTLLKNKPKKSLDFPIRSERGDYTVLGIYYDAVCTVIDLTGSKTPQVIAWLEKEFGKEITTRTWKTVERIVNSLDKMALKSSG